MRKNSLVYMVYFSVMVNFLSHLEVGKIFLLRLD